MPPTLKNIKILAIALDFFILWEIDFKGLRSWNAPAESQTRESEEGLEPCLERERSGRRRREQAERKTGFQAPTNGGTRYCSLISTGWLLIVLKMPNARPTVKIFKNCNHGYIKLCTPSSNFSKTWYILKSSYLLNKLKFVCSWRFSPVIYKKREETQGSRKLKF